MFVRELMSADPVTVPSGTSVPAALRLMREKRVRRLPVLDKHGRLAGIVSDKDLLQASPSPATTLAVWEIPELLGKIKVDDVMTRTVITITGDTPLEEAARLMADRKIGGLPVMEGEKLVGIITETDLFKALLHLMGARRSGVRLTVSAIGAKGTLARVTSAIASVGGDIVGIGVKELPPEEGGKWEMIFKVQDASKDALVGAVKPVVDTIVDVRETSGVGE